MQNLSVLSSLFVDHPEDNPHTVGHMVEDVCEVVRIPPDHAADVRESLLRQGANARAGSPLSVAVHRVMSKYVEIWDGTFYFALCALAVSEQWGIPFRYFREGEMMCRAAREMIEVAEMAGLPDTVATPRWQYDLYVEVMRLLGSQRVQDGFEDVEACAELASMVGPLSDVLWIGRETLEDCADRLPEDPYFIKQSWRTLLWCGRRRVSPRRFTELLATYGPMYYSLFHTLLSEDRLTQEAMDALWNISDDLAGFSPCIIRECLNEWQRRGGRRRTLVQATQRVMKRHCRTSKTLGSCALSCVRCPVGALIRKYEEAS